jgi:hypothetical protein
LDNREFIHAQCRFYAAAERRLGLHVDKLRTFPDRARSYSGENGFSYYFCRKNSYRDEESGVFSSRPNAGPTAA